MEIIAKHFIPNPSNPLKTRKIILRQDEHSLVQVIDRLVEENKNIKIGSYPFVDHNEYKLIISLEAGESTFDFNLNYPVTDISIFFQNASYRANRRRN